MKTFYTSKRIIKRSLPILSFMLLSSTLWAQLSGTYTINKNATATSTNYQTFASLVSDLNFGTRADAPTLKNGPGVSNAVVVNVVTGSGPYTEQISINAITGSSITRTITINGNGETIQFTPTSTAAAHTIQLNGADFFIFDNLRVVGNATAIGRAFWLTNAADFNVIRNCTISFPNMTSMTSNNNAYIAITTGTSTMLTYGNSGNDNTIINNTMFSGVNRGPYSGIAIINESTGTVVRRNTIIGNNIKDTYFTGVWGYYPFAQTIKHNEIHNTGSSMTGTKSGVYFVNSNKGGDHTIDSNYIHDLTTASAVVYGIYMTASNGTGSNGISMSGNRILHMNSLSTFYGIYLYSYINYFIGEMNINHNDIRMTNHTTTSTNYGIYNYVYYSYNATSSNVIGNNIDMNCRGAAYANMNYLAYSAFTKPCMIANNVISMRNSSLAYGIYAYAWSSSFTTHMVYNTIYSDDHFVNNATSTKYLAYPGYTSGDFKNNHLMSEDNGGTVYPIYYWAGSKKIDNNNIFMDNCTANVLYYNSGTTYNSWADYKTGMGGANDSKLNPNFKSIATNDFTPTAFSLVNKGTPITGITKDFFNVNRNTTTPDIGAIEYYIDIAISNLVFSATNVCGGYTEAVKVTVTNNTLNEIQNVPVAFEINGTRRVSEVITSKIGAGKSIDYTFSTPAIFNFPGNSLLTVFLNGSDDNLTNNLVSKSVVVTPSPFGGTLAESGTYPGYFRQGGSGGLITNPDITIPDLEVTYSINNPTNYINATYGSDWTMAANCFTSNGTPVTGGVMFTAPNGTNKGSISFKPGSILMDSMVFVAVKATNITTNCDSTFGRWVYIPHVPNVNFAFSTVCDGDVIEFKNTTSIAKGNMLYDWQFNDPNSNEDATDVAEPIYKYVTYGTYKTDLNIRLAAYPKFVFTKSHTVVVTAVPVIDFKVLNACEKLPVTIINDTKLPAGVAGTISYTWNYGGAGSGDPVNTKSPKYTYNNVGGYKITLTASSNGCASTLTKNANQFANPKASFTKTGTCNLEPIAFKNNSTIAKGSTGFTWNFGDNTISNLRDPEHEFLTPGSKTVKLMAISEFGCKDSSSVTFNLAESPKADFTFSDPCNLTEVKFNRTGTLPAGVNSIYEWNFNGEKTSTVENPSILFNTLGFKNVSLIVRSANGCTDNVTKSFAVKLQAKANFTANDVCEGEAISFTNKSSVAAGELNYEWRLGDGTLSTKTAPKHAYTINGSTKTFLVTLVANVNGGCSDSVTKAVTINAKTDASFNVAMQGRTAIFTQTTTETSNLYNWRFGDGGKSNGINPTYSYSNVDKGTFTACLGVINASGCISESCKTVSIDLVSVQDVNKNTLAVYPNPTVGKLVVDLNKWNASTKINVTNLEGKLLYSEVFNATDKINLDLSGLANGLYLIQVTDDNNTSTQRVTISH